MQTTVCSGHKSQWCNIKSEFSVLQTKLQYIIIIEGCVDSVQHKFYILMVGAYIHIVWSSNTNKHAPFWPQESKSRKSNFQTWKFCLKIGIYFRNISQKKSLLNLLFWTIFVSDANTIFFTWTHTTDIISLIEFNNIFFFVSLSNPSL